MKTKIIFCMALVVGFCLISTNAFSQETKDQKKANATTKSAVKSEPVPGAEITVEQVPPGGQIIRCITNKNGEFTFSFPKGYKLPSSGELTLTITPPKTSVATDKKQELNGDEIGGRKMPTTKQKITVKFKTEKGMIDAWCTCGPYSHAYSNLEDEQKGTKGTTLKFILIWNPPDPIKSNKGGFAISGKNTD